MLEHLVAWCIDLSSSLHSCWYHSFLWPWIPSISCCWPQMYISSSTLSSNVQTYLCLLRHSKFNNVNSYPLSYHNLSFVLGSTLYLHLLSPNTFESSFILCFLSDCTQLTSGLNHGLYPENVFRIWPLVTTLPLPLYPSHNHLLHGKFQQLPNCSFMFPTVFSPFGNRRDPFKMQFRPWYSTAQNLHCLLSHSKLEPYTAYRALKNLYTC